MWREDFVFSFETEVEDQTNWIKFASCIGIFILEYSFTIHYRLRVKSNVKKDTFLHPTFVHIIFVH